MMDHLFSTLYTCRSLEDFKSNNSEKKFWPWVTKIYRGVILKLRDVKGHDHFFRKLI